ncbi:MAG TPA: helix-turn-helix domain-containing protein [Candidatus Dormibacteraeota bacterium]|nr:helix-turn-helix domain-containing protein [Candidatus Dormibacteraeota bacterium]
MLDRRDGERRFHLDRVPPADDLLEVVEHLWIVRWDLRGRPPYPQHTLPHPAVHLAVEAGQAQIYGVTRGRFTRVLRDAGWAFAVKFTPAGFHQILKGPVSALTDRRVAVGTILGGPGRELVRGIRAEPEDEGRIELAMAFVRARIGDGDSRVATVNGVVARIAAEADLLRAEQVAERTGIARRTLQRLFQEYVGVGPKWVIRRYRLHEAAERLAAGDSVDLADLALELGYFDQAHLARDFHATTGSTPAEYARRNATNGAEG